MSFLKTRVFSENYYEDLDYRSTVIPLLDALLEGKSNNIERAFSEAIASRIETAIAAARQCIAEDISINEAGFKDVSNMSSRQIQKMGHNDNNDAPSRSSRPSRPAPAKSTSGKKVLRQVRYPADYDETKEGIQEAGFVDVSNMSSRQIQKMGHNDNNDAPSRSSRPAPAKSTSGKKVLRQVRYPADYDETADGEHSVHINGKPWKSFGTKAHATNVAKKIKGATVHPAAGTVLGAKAWGRAV